MLHRHIARIASLYRSRIYSRCYGWIANALAALKILAVALLRLRFCALPSRPRSHPYSSTIYPAPVLFAIGLLIGMSLASTQGTQALASSNADDTEALAQGSQDEHPGIELARTGEVAVYAQPGDLEELEIIKTLPESGIQVVEVSAGKELGLVNRLRDRGMVADLNLEAQAFASPNDPIYSFQWHFDEVQAEAAWDLSTGAGVTVAVLDTGLANGGADGIGCVVQGRDVVNSDDQPFDGHGHGTHVAGTVAQATDNAVGVAGLAHGACVMPVKVLADSGSGSTADIAEGIYFAVNNGAKVINMSLGFSTRRFVSRNSIIDPALEYAAQNGVTVVVASGNDGNRRFVSYPASHASTISVGATGIGGAIAPYSNRGRGLDLVAPGGDTSKDVNGDGYADGVLQETRSGGSWGYQFFQGTSMASPHVAAAAAILISAGEHVSPDQVRDALSNSALDLGDGGHDNTYGAGLLQVYSALNWDNTSPPEPTSPPTGSCTDLDGDGICLEDGDCDDNDRTVHPGHSDRGGRWGRDGKDNDCNGIIDG